jgi:uncharacterized lipoprotein YehR (DUF1307 family)
MSKQFKLLIFFFFALFLSIIVVGCSDKEKVVITNIKQLNDKERVAAALENSHLLEVVHKCISGSD